MHIFTAESRRQARLYNIPTEIVDAIIMVESGGEQSAWNPEQKYRWFWNVKTKAPFRQITAVENQNEYPPKDFPCLAGDPDQEWWAQQASWGLMQLMGAVLRERGYLHAYIPAILLHAEQNVEFGCKHLAAYFKRWGSAHGWCGVVGAYNAGSPTLTDENYIAKIEKFCPDIRNM